MSDDLAARAALLRRRLASADRRRHGASKALQDRLERVQMAITGDLGYMEECQEREELERWWRKTERERGKGSGYGPNKRPQCPSCRQFTGADRWCEDCRTFASSGYDHGR